MREGHDGQVRVFPDDAGERTQQAGQARPDQDDRFPDAKGVGVVLDVHGGGAEVDDPARRRALLGEGFDLGHQVVPYLRLDGERALDVDVARLRLELGDLRRRGEAVAHLHARQAHPEGAPKLPLVHFAPDAPHFIGPVSPGIGGEVSGIVCHEPTITESGEAANTSSLSLNHGAWRMASP